MTTTTRLYAITYSIKMNSGSLAGMTITDRTLAYPTLKAAREWVRVVTAKGIAGELPYTIVEANIAATTLAAYVARRAN